MIKDYVPALRKTYTEVAIENANASFHIVRIDE